MLTETLALKQPLPLVSEAMYAPHAQQPHIALPRLWVKGNCFFCDDEALAFQPASRRFAMLKAFLAGHSHQLNREQIIALVYGESQLHRRSLRYATCLASNVLRMISDTRRQLYLAYAGTYPGIDWLHFNRGEKKWKLTRLRDDYVLTQIKVKIFHAARQHVHAAPHSGLH